MYVFFYFTKYYFKTNILALKPYFLYVVSDNWKRDQISEVN